MEVFHCEFDPKTDLPDWEGQCFAKPKTMEYCKKVLAAWAMGSGVSLFQLRDKQLYFTLFYLILFYLILFYFILICYF